MRKLLDTLYLGTACLAGLFMIGTLAMILAGILGRLLDFNIRGTDSYAGFCIVAALFLASAHTLKRGEHIRVTLLLQHVGARVGRGMEILSHVVGVVVCSVVAWFSISLARQSYLFNDVSQGMDGTPLWIPQLSMALGAIVLAIAMVDDLAILLAGRPLERPDQELARIE